MTSAIHVTVADRASKETSATTCLGRRASQNLVRPFQ